MSFHRNLEQYCIIMLLHCSLSSVLKIHLDRVNNWAVLSGINVHYSADVLLLIIELFRCCIKNNDFLLGEEFQFVLISIQT